MHRSGPLKQIEAGVLNIGYAEAGPSGGPLVILLHGWPYDIHSFVDVAPLLASRGYRVIVPYLRGYGTTRFLSRETPRNGQQSVVAVDVIALMDALRIETAVVAGFDWGARTANIVAALWPERCKALVSVSGYLIGSRDVNKMPLPPKAELECRQGCRRRRRLRVTNAWRKSCRSRSTAGRARSTCVGCSFTTIARCG
jgi:pimeloyl-ACP methyl ester carboxylesterase